MPAESRVVFMGSPAFAVYSLDALVGAGYKVDAVVTQPDRPSGRGRKITPPPVKQRALSLGLRVLQPQRASDIDFINEIRRLAPDVIIVAAYGQILKPDLLNLAPCGAINIHASLLPKYRGAAPIQWVILNQEKTTGLTLMRMDAGLDTGPIILQRAISIEDDETFGGLHERLAVMSGPFLLEGLQGLREAALLERRQDDRFATYAPKISKEMNVIDWNAPSDQISALIRALDPFPGAVSSFRGARVKLFASRAVSPVEGLPVPGRIFAIEREGLVVEAGSGAVLVREMQVSGKRRVMSYECSRGLGLKAGAVLGL
ncbi:methionyl-tRNA formyltransferase [bacterium]|nr:methionyl-tRNA formyltransferase [bacterium]